MAADARSPGSDWLAHCSSSPATVRRAWADEDLAAVPAKQWAVVEADLLPSIEAMHALRSRRRSGPVLAAPEMRLAWWLIPVDAAAYVAEAMPAVTVQPRSWPLRCPPTEYACGGRCWLEKPDGTGRLTDPAQLVAAFGSAAAVLAAPQCP